MDLTTIKCEFCPFRQKAEQKINEIADEYAKKKYLADEFDHYTKGINDLRDALILELMKEDENANR